MIPFELSKQVNQRLISVLLSGGETEDVFLNISNVSCRSIRVVWWADLEYARLKETGQQIAACNTFAKNGILFPHIYAFSWLSGMEIVDKDSGQYSCEYYRSYNKARCFHALLKLYVVRSLSPHRLQQ